MVGLKEAALIACKCGYDREIHSIGAIIELPDSYFFMFGSPYGGMVDVKKSDGATTYTFLPPEAHGIKGVDIPVSTLRDMFE